MNVVAGLVAFAEFAVILAVGLAVHAFYLQKGLFAPLPYSAMLTGAAAAMVAVNKVMGGYGSRRCELRANPAQGARALDPRRLCLCRGDVPGQGLARTSRGSG